LVVPVVCVIPVVLVRAVGQDVQVAAFGGGHPQRGGQRVQDLRRRPDRAALLEERVVGGGQAGQQRDLLAAQAGRAPALADGQAHVAGRQALAPGPEQLAQGCGISAGRHDP
jgi:hypothetical protein